MTIRKRTWGKNWLQGRYLNIPRILSVVIFWCQLDSTLNNVACTYSVGTKWTGRAHCAEMTDIREQTADVRDSCNKRADDYNINAVNNEHTSKRKSYHCSACIYAFNHQKYSV